MNIYMRLPRMQMNLHEHDEATLYTVVIVAILAFALYYLAEPFFYRPLPAYDNVINVRILRNDGTPVFRGSGAPQ